MVYGVIDDVVGGLLLHSWVAEFLGLVLQSTGGHLSSAKTGASFMKLVLHLCTVLLVFTNAGGVSMVI